TGRRSQAADCDLKLVPCTMIEFTKLLLPERRYSSGCHQLLLQYSCGRECCPRRSKWRHPSCLGQAPFLRYFSPLLTCPYPQYLVSYHQAPLKFKDRELRQCSRRYSPRILSRLLAPRQIPASWGTVCSATSSITATPATSFPSTRLRRPSSAFPLSRPSA